MDRTLLAFLGGAGTFAIASFVFNRLRRAERRNYEEGERPAPSARGKSIPGNSFSFFGKKIHLWSDPEYSRLDIRTPDLLEKRLYELVQQGTAYFAMPWYEAFREMCNEGYLSNSELPAHPIKTAEESQS